jgi:HEAT repeat protein
VGPILDRLDDEVMFVRAHACRAAGRLGGPGVAPRLLPLLGDSAWWVRAAAKDTLGSFGAQVAPLLFEELDSPDRFARNGAAEVLQDLGIVDELLRTTPDSPLLHRIFRAGGRGFVDAARLRADGDPGQSLEPPVDRQAAA